MVYQWYIDGISMIYQWYINGISHISLVLPYTTEYITIGIPGNH